LFIGRFQPFHKGHLQIIQYASLDYDKIIIGIGSSQYKCTTDNPFSSEERQQMIDDTLKNLDIGNYEIVLVPDIHNYPKWVVHVASIITDFDVVLTNSSLTKSLFEEQGFEIRETPIFERKKYSGKEIRKKMINDEKWEDLVPEPVVKIIKKIDGVNRLRELAKKQ